MSNKIFIKNFRAAVSNERIDKYRQRGVSGGDENLLVHYAWNIALAESLYPILQCMEIALRNSVHDAATVAYRSEFWFDTPGLLEAKSVDEIAKARANLTAMGKPITAAGLIAEQNFGFWTACFNTSQEGLLWPRIYRQTFPGLPKHLRKRSTIMRQLNDIRKLRNRIFHHEPIWYFNDLRPKHAQILQLIDWMSPAMSEFATAIDRFPALYNNGMTTFQSELEKKLAHVNQQPIQPLTS